MTPKSSSVNVLVVDDDPMSRDLLSALFEMQGYLVECADSGAAALQMLQERDHFPQVILADIQMPGISGPQLVQALRTLCGPQTLLLAMSASGPSWETLSCFDGFLLKPFTMQQVASAFSSMPTPGPSPAPFSHPSASNIPMNGSMHEPLAEPAGASSAPDQPGTTPVIDERIYSQLAEAMPGPQLKQMYFMCMRDARDRIATMRRLADEHDETQFGRQAHAIKGGCGMLGASELYAMASRLESFGLHAPSHPGVNRLDELSAACDRLERILGARL